MLTEDMTRLSNEIGDLRDKRAGMMQQLVADSQDRHKSVSAFRSSVNSNLKAAANALRDKRVTGLNQLKQEVSSVRQATKNDLDGVRSAWTGRA